MHSLPTGTVTLLFSDMEGSTGLLMRLGSSYSQVLDGVRSAQRSAWRDHGGTEMGTEGDSFFVVFESAVSAALAAAQAQRQLAGHPWPGGETVLVRVGFHTGNPTVHDDGYVGKDVHRAARIAAAAHGGQVVLSEVSAELVRQELTPGLGLRSLGSHQLKDLPRPERLYQLTIDDLPGDFPPLKSLGAGSNLPMPPDDLVGRDKELAELADALSLARVRLVTLTGPGGAGKTRLAVELAHQLVADFPDGVFFVPLAGVTTTDLLWPAVADAMALRLPDRDAPQLFGHLANRTVLLVLDNLEQLEGADAAVAELLARASGLSVLATSRRPLHLSAEREYGVAPLDLPTDDSFEAAEASGAVQLFVQLARRVRQSFALTRDNAADVAALCRRLDGLPLALELAAARTKLLSPHALLGRLDQALDISAPGAQVPDRQRTLRQAIAWSEELLTEPLRAFFHRMAVFSGGADLPAVEAVAVPDDAAADPLDLVSDLVDASLLTVGESDDGEPRVDMLRTVQTYAHECLRSSAGYDAVRARHAEHYAAMAEELAAGLIGVRRREVRRRFELEQDNFRAALTWCLPDAGPRDAASSEAEPAQSHGRSGDRTGTGLRMCIALNGQWRANGYTSEMRRWLERAVRQAGDRETPERARCLSLLARSLRSTGEIGRAYELSLASLDMAKRVDPSRTAVLTALSTVAVLDVDQANVAEARGRYEEAVQLARDLGDRVALFGSLADLAAMETSARRYERALRLGAEAVAVAEELEYTAGALMTRHNIGWTLMEMDRLDEAAAQMQEVITQALELDEPAMVLPQALDLAVVLERLGEPELAVLLLGATDAGFERLGIMPDPIQVEDRTVLVAQTQALLSPDEWETTYDAGRRTPLEDALDAVGAVTRSSV